MCAPSHGVLDDVEGAMIFAPEAKDSECQSIDNPQFSWAQSGLKSLSGVNSQAW